MKNKISKAKLKLIDKISKLISKGDGLSVTTGEMQAESSPMYSSVGNVVSLLEQFYNTKALVITYANDNEIDEFYVDYRNLSMTVLKEIYDLLKDYVETLEEA